jgi:hypothetical protein
MKKEITTIDINLNEVKSKGTAYFRITPAFRDFLKLCQEKEGVIGFEYDFDSLNFGVILSDK